MAGRTQQRPSWPKILVSNLTLGGTRNGLPLQFELTKSNVMCWIVIASRAKSNVLGLLVVAKPHLGCLVETADNVVDVVEMF